MKPHHRRGFTLFQLLVLLALLAILFALLVPALAKARLSAARAQSLNNLKQMCLAINNVASNTATGDLPSGEDDNHFSVAAHLLPYIEQQNVYQMIDFKKSVDDKANADARKILIKTFISP